VCWRLDKVKSISASRAPAGRSSAVCWSVQLWSATLAFQGPIWLHSQEMPAPIWIARCWFCCLAPALGWWNERRGAATGAYRTQPQARSIFPGGVLRDSGVADPALNSSQRPAYRFSIPESVSSSQWLKGWTSAPRSLAENGWPQALAPASPCLERNWRC